MPSRSSETTQPQRKTGPAKDELWVRDEVVEVQNRLCDEYGCPVDYFHSLNPLSELISALLSHRTRNHDSGRAFRALQERYKDWERVRDADPAEVEATIPMVTWPEQKAPRIQEVLRRVGDRCGGDLNLEFLADMEPRSARDWLEELPGVGPKTSAAVLSFSRLRMRALPVDSHHYRVAQRLGWIPKSVSVGPSHAILERFLPEDWDAQQVYDHHEILMFHGQRVCRHRSPKCERCVLLDLCPTGRELQYGSSDAEVPKSDRPAKG